MNDSRFLKLWNTLGLDSHLLHNLGSHPSCQVDIQHTVIPSAERMNDIANLHLLMSFKMLIRLIRITTKAMSVAQNQALIESARNCLTDLLKIPRESLLNYICRSEIATVIASLSTAIATGSQSKISTSLNFLGNVLLGPLLLGNGLSDGTEILARRSTATRLHIPLLRKSICFSPNSGDLVRITRRGDMLIVDTGDVQAIPIAALIAGMSDCNVATITTVPTTNIFLPRHDRLFDELLPSDLLKRAGAFFHDIGDEEFHLFEKSMTAGMSLVEEYWAAAYQGILIEVDTILPLQNKGLAPNNWSVDNCRGLVACGSRPSYLASQSLVHEAGHNRFGSILDLFHLYDNPSSERYLSPFVGNPRPWSAIFHGVFSFIQDLYLSRRLYGKVPEIEGLSLIRYIDDITRRINEGLKLINQHAQLTDHGRALVTAFEEVM